MRVFRSSNAAKALGYIAIVIASVGGFVYFQNKDERSSAKITSERVSIVASFYPLAEFARHVGGDAVDVMTVTPAGVEPHEYEPSPGDVAKIYASRLFLLNGFGLDPWAERVAAEVRAKGGEVVNMSEQVTGTHRASDPHMWLDPVLAIGQVNAIADVLMRIDPSHAETYAQNRDVYVSTLRQLDREYTEGLAQCQQRTIVTSHDAFGYLADRYQLRTAHIVGLSPEEEPSPQQIAELTNIIRREKIKVVFFETLVSPRLAQTLAEESGASSMELNPIEGLTQDEVRAGKDYVQLMRANLANVRTALVCP